MLTLSKLLPFALKYRNQLRNLKYNSVKYVAQKRLAPIIRYLGKKMKLRLQVHTARVTVEFRPNYKPQQDVDETIDLYEAKVQRLGKDVDKLLHVLAVADLRVNDIRWHRFERLLSFVD